MMTVEGPRARQKRSRWSQGLSVRATPSVGMHRYQVLEKAHASVAVLSQVVDHMCDARKHVDHRVVVGDAWGAIARRREAALWWAAKAGSVQCGAMRAILWPARSAHGVAREDCVAYAGDDGGRLLSEDTFFRGEAVRPTGPLAQIEAIAAVHPLPSAVNEDIL